MFYKKECKLRSTVFFPDRFENGVSKQNEVFISFHVPTCWMWLDHKCLWSIKPFIDSFFYISSMARTNNKKINFIQTLKLQIKLINLVKAEYSGLFVVFYLSFVLRAAAVAPQPGCSPRLSGKFPGPVPAEALLLHSSQWWRSSPQTRCTWLCLCLVPEKGKIEGQSKRTQWFPLTCCRLCSRLCHKCLDRHEIMTIGSVVAKLR